MKIDILSFVLRSAWLGFSYFLGLLTAAWLYIEMGQWFVKRFEWFLKFAGCNYLGWIVWTTVILFGSITWAAIGLVIAVLVAIL